MNTDFNKTQEEYMHKMMGCSRDHAKEIDLYSKDYGSKIERIMKMIGEANKALVERNEAK